MIRVGVLRGGTSHNYEESLRSGAHIMKNLPRDKYEVVDLYIDREGVWHINGIPATHDKLLHRIDIVWNALQGFYGEDGKVQRLLDTLHIPYTGSGPVPAAVAKNKKLTKEVCANLGLCTPQDVYVEDWGQADPDVAAMHVAREVFKKLSPPWMVKPIASEHGGFTVKCKTRDELIDVLRQMCDNRVPVLIEEVVFGKHASVLTLDGFRGKKDYTLMPVSKDLSHTHVSSTESAELQKLAAQLHHALGLSQYSNMEAVVTPRGKIYVLSMDVTPPLHEESALQHSLTSVGASFKEFAEHMLGKK